MFGFVYKWFVLTCIICQDFSGFVIFITFRVPFTFIQKLCLLGIHRTKSSYCIEWLGFHIEKNPAESHYDIFGQGNELFVWEKKSNVDGLKFLPMDYLASISNTEWECQNMPCSIGQQVPVWTI